MNTVIIQFPTLRSCQNINLYCAHGEMELTPIGFGKLFFSGSVPVVKYHYAYENFKKLPIIFYENIEDLTLDFLVENEKKYKFELF